MSANAVVRARVDSQTKALATAALEAMGLSVSDVIRVLMRRIADEQCIPFEVRKPNRRSRQAIAELEAGQGVRFTGVEALLWDLNA